MSWVAVAIGGSAALGAGSNALQGQSTNRAGRKSRDWYGTQTGQGAARYGSTLFGPNGWMDLVNGNLGGADGKSAKAARGRFNDLIGGSLVDQSNALTGLAGSNANIDRYNTDTNSLLSAYGGERDRQAGQYGGNTLNLLGSIGRGNAGLMNQFNAGASGLTGLADQFGRGQEQIIGQDADRFRKAQDQLTSARLASSGFGNSTAAAQAYAGNAQAASDQKNRRLADLNSAQVDRKLAVGGDVLRGRTALGQSNNALFQGALADRLGRSEGADSSLGQGMLSAYGSRLAGKGQLDENNLQRLIQAMSAKIGLLNSSGQSSTLQPWLQQNTMGYYPGVSGAAQGGMSAGNSLGLLGGYLLSQQKNNQPQWT